MSLHLLYRPLKLALVMEQGSQNLVLRATYVCCFSSAVSLLSCSNQHTFLRIVLDSSIFTAFKNGDGAPSLSSCSSAQLQGGGAMRDGKAVSTLIGAAQCDQMHRPAEAGRLLSTTQGQVICWRVRLLMRFAARFCRSHLVPNIANAVFSGGLKGSRFSSHPVRSSPCFSSPYLRWFAKSPSMRTGGFLEYFFFGRNCIAAESIGILLPCSRSIFGLQVFALFMHFVWLFSYPQDVPHLGSIRSVFNLSRMS
ncbi:hypothetical protein BKA65DRAFT_173741 [Rhexocercosporidium sp. MPI-PUGE-AT-0058]|nr:hypothetical protein BKA65DRAFT_173741 [Rhexocercosporidium sp. MPI-PUGE-AT-0058]